MRGKYEMSARQVRILDIKILNCWVVEDLARTFLTLAVKFGWNLVHTFSLH